MIFRFYVVLSYLITTVSNPREKKSFSFEIIAFFEVVYFTNGSKIKKDLKLLEKREGQN